MTDSRERHGHFRAEVIDHVKQISSVVIPRGYKTLDPAFDSSGLQPTVVAQKQFVQDSTSPLVSHICDPDAAYPETIAFRTSMELFP